MSKKETTLKEQMEEGNPLNKEMFKTKRIENTPFALISKIEENEHFAVFGECKMTNVYDNPETAIEEAQKVTYNGVAVMIHEMLKNKNLFK